MDNKGEVWKMFLIMLPYLGATLIAASRIMDARHHPLNLNTGSLLAMICASISYRQYFPSLAEPWKKGCAHPIRSWGTTPTNPDAPGVSENTETGFISTYPPPYPYVTNVYPRRAHGDTYSSSSEEDVTNGYEMQQGYARTYNSGVSGHIPTYEPGMAYHSRTQATTPEPGPGPILPPALAINTGAGPHKARQYK
ncbi:hypothetical protein BDV11DRAFT_171515 [Aspergillus similis]